MDWLHSLLAAMLPHLWALVATLLAAFFGALHTWTRRKKAEVEKAIAPDLARIRAALTHFFNAANVPESIALTIFTLATAAGRSLDEFTDALILGLRDAADNLEAESKSTPSH